MKTIKDFELRGHKRSCVHNYYSTRSKDELVSLIMMLFYPEDIDVEYNNLPDEFKKKYPHTASKE